MTRRGAVSDGGAPRVSRMAATMFVAAMPHWMPNTLRVCSSA